MLVMSMLGCTQEEAQTYLDRAEGDVLAAIEANIAVPDTKGNKYVPAKPVVDDGLTPDVREKLQKARELADMFSASFRNDLRGSQQTAAPQPAAAQASHEPLPAQ